LTELVLRHYIEKTMERNVHLGYLPPGIGLSNRKSDKWLNF